MNSTVYNKEEWIQESSEAFHCASASFVIIDDAVVVGVEGREE